MSLCCAGTLHRPLQDPFNALNACSSLFFFIAVRADKKVNNLLWKEILHLPAPPPFETKEFKTQVF